jgi:hypothetical protein
VNYGIPDIDAGLREIRRRLSDRAIEALKRQLTSRLSALLTIARTHGARLKFMSAP